MTDKLDHIRAVVSMIFVEYFNPLAVAPTDERCDHDPEVARLRF